MTNDKNYSFPFLFIPCEQSLLDLPFFLLLYPYCAFHKHANSKVQKPSSQLRFSLPSIIITITSNEPGNTETHKTDRNPPIANHKPWPFEPLKVKFCFLRGPLRWLMAAKNQIVGWLLNFRIRMFVKSAVNCSGGGLKNSNQNCEIITLTIIIFVLFITVLWLSRLILTALIHLLLVLNDLRQVLNNSRFPLTFWMADRNKASIDFW